MPHAKDFLLQDNFSPEFKSFTLWSQHLLLHTRESFFRILKAAGFSKVSVKASQRYGLSNHLKWLIEKTPGGHKSSFAILETEELKKSYSDSLAQIDACDTLIAYAFR